MNKIVTLTEKGEIGKRVCWQMMREKFKLLDECRILLEGIPECSGIHITRDGVIYEAQDGGKLLFDFEELPLSRAESMLCRTEREDWDFIWSMIPEDGTVMDIGANVGWFSIQLAKKYPRAKIYAFEPVEGTFAKMKRNLALNGILDVSSRGGHVYINNTGLYDKDGDITIYVPGSSEASSLQPIDDEFYLNEESGQTAQRCRIQTMDIFVREQGIETLDFIKCDTEGAEKMVFSGASHVLGELVPIVYTEMLRKHSKRFGYHPNDIIKLFRGFGYNCYREENRRLIPFESMDEETLETNFFFLHGEKHAGVIKKRQWR